MEQPLILLVDDNSRNLQVLGNLLEGHYHTAIAKSGLKALEFVKRKRPDLILLDIMMPEMDGFEVCQKLQAFPETNDIPIIFLTAKSEARDVVKGFELGAADYVTKPFQKQELLARVRTQLKLKQSENWLRQGLTEAQQLAQMGSWVWDLYDNSLTWSDEMYRIFGMSSQHIAVSSEMFLEYIHPEDREMMENLMQTALRQNKAFELDHRIVRANGIERIVHTEAKTDFDKSNRPLRILGMSQDITERRQLEIELKKLSMVIEESINFVFITNHEGSIEYVNPIFERVTGYSKQELIGQNPRILGAGETSEQVYAELWMTITSGKTWRGTLKNRKKNGVFYWVNGVISPIKNEDGQITHFLAIQEDISEKMLAEQRALYLSTYDQTTGLLNRETFIERLAELISATRSGVVILTDIDEFRLISDAYGHTMADEFLKRLTRMITETVEHLVEEESYIIGRLGEHEIAVSLSEKHGSKGLEIAEQIGTRIETFKFSRESLHTTLSIGIVAFPEHGTTTRELLSRVDVAVSRAKEPGKTRCHLFSPEDKDIEALHSRLRQKQWIINALEHGRFEPWFQPILNLKKNRIHHYEALARMRGEDENIVLPGAFIATAESLGLIDAIDRTITKKTIHYQASLKHQGHNLSFTMNLSGKHLGDEHLLDFLKTTIDESGADPYKLIFEITETAAIYDLNKAIAFINALKLMGCRFALDDFGVGFTSFLYLKEMDVDFIKIDGLFIRRLHEHRDDQNIAKAMVAIAKGMHIKTIAEFVEQDATIGLLKEFGVDYAQGFLIGKPAPCPLLS